MNPRTMERIDAALEGRLDEAEFRALETELMSDPAALEHWCRQAEIHGRLEWELAAPAAAVPAPVRKRGHALPRAAAAAALVAGGLALGFLAGRQGVPQVVEKEDRRSPDPAAFPAVLVARVTASLDARWGGTGGPQEGMVPTGLLDLKSGSAEITFDSGAAVLLRAPARLHVMSPARALLEGGHATVTVPAHAFGFVLETPAMEISRRSSRFAVAVDRDGQTEIHVLDGSIRLDGKLGELKSLELAKDRAVRMTGDGALSGEMRYDTDQLAFSLPESAELLPEYYHHWSFDSTDPSTGVFADAGPRLAPEERHDAQVHLADEGAAVDLVPGRFGNAVRFNGQRAFLATRFPGFEGSSPRTVSFWVMIDPDTPDSLAYSVLSWGTKNPGGGGKWQIGWNTGSDNSGTVGAIRTEVELGHQVGATDLRTGRWHHVACVFSGGPGSDIATSVRHYVDGRLEAATSVRPRAVETLVTGAGALPLSFGRRLDADDAFRTFRGGLDEVYLFPCALTPEQIQGLYRSNRPPDLRR